MAACCFELSLSLPVRAQGAVLPPLTGVAGWAGRGCGPCRSASRRALAGRPGATPSQGGTRSAACRLAVRNNAARVGANGGDTRYDAGDRESGKVPRIYTTSGDMTDREEYLQPMIPLPCIRKPFGSHSKSCLLGSNAIL